MDYSLSQTPSQPSGLSRVAELYFRLSRSADFIVGRRVQVLSADQRLVSPSRLESGAASSVVLLLACLLAFKSRYREGLEAKQRVEQGLVSM